MRSKMCFFNKGVAKNLLRRTWPLWAGYTALLLLLTLGSGLTNTGSRPGQSLALVAILTANGLPFGLGMLAAMSLFSFLYSSRGCGMMTSLPLRREELFCTVYLTGLLPQLGAVALTGLLAALALLRAPGQAAYALSWMGLTALGSLFYYGMAVFCAMLTGNIVILPVIYVLLNMAAFVLEFCGEWLMEVFLYGYMGNRTVLMWLSPPAELYRLLNGCDFSKVNPGAKVWGLMAAYAGVGLVLSALALLLFRRRQMERAGDTAAYPFLKPLFRGCMALGAGIVLPMVLVECLFPGIREWKGSSNAVLIGALAALGAALGYFGAEMLIQRSLRVFRGRWKGCAALCLFMIALTACLELDLFGIERRVPAPETVAKAELYGADVTGDLEELLSLHRQIIGHKARNEASPANRELPSLPLVYRLKNGRILQRSYDLDGGEEALADQNSDLRTVQRLLNTPESIEARLNLEGRATPLDREHLKYVELNTYYREGAGCVLTGDQAMDFIQNCLLPDVRDGQAGYFWYILDDDYYDLNTEFRAEICLVGQRLNADGEPYQASESMYIGLQMNSERCLNWIQENTDLELQPLRVTDPPVDGYNPGFNIYGLGRWDATY